MQAQAARREKESVPALVERAREVINRRMERMPTAPTWQAPYQRLYHPATAAQPSFEQSEVNQLRAPAAQVVSTGSLSSLPANSASMFASCQIPCNESFPQD